MVNHGVEDSGDGQAQRQKSPSCRARRKAVPSSVRAAAQDGKANRALVDILADHFGVAKSTVKIIRGHSARHKLIEIG